MKKLKLILALLIFSIASCTERKIEIIDGCQYIKTTTVNGNGISSETLCHKGDCNNPIHLRNDQYKEIDDEPHGPVTDTFKPIAMPKTP